MEESTMRFNEMQLKRSGFAEAITPELKKKMEEGVAVIQHHFKKDYDGDKVDATLHLKKSSTSDHYFLNKFDLQLQKDGQAETLKQTFYINRPKNAENEESNQQKTTNENKYTLKEAYNLLAGRPVFKHLTSKEGQEYEAWVKINFKNTLDNGNHEIKQYNKNYGFELETTLSKYPIRELANEKYKESLFESLQRGNLQKVTFVANNGKEEKLYISPSITLGALNVYDLNRQRIPTEKLVEKQYIGKDRAEEMNQRVSKEQKKDQTQTQKQEPPPSQKQEQKQKQERQKIGASEKKQTRKHKIH